MTDEDDGMRNSDEGAFSNFDFNWSRQGPRSVLPGLLLIALGIFFLANQFTDFQLDNWWALFILIPAVNNFSSALGSFRQSGRFGRRERSGFFWALFFTLLSAAFIFNLDFALIWPAFLILAGFGVLLGAL